MEHLDVLVVGAGLSGIGAGCYLKNESPWAKFAIVESRGAIGGTWDLFRYPGIRSDSDMFTLGYSFRPWDGKKTIADGASILQYIKDTATEYDLDELIRFNTRVTAADWSTEDACWHVTLSNTETGATTELTAGFIYSCTGYYRYDHGHQPDFPGLASYTGQVIHPQGWPEDLDYAGKRIVVIGSGATAVTLVPSLAETAGHVTMLQRSPSYIVSVPAASPLIAIARRLGPTKRAARLIRWVLALGTQGSYFLSKRRPGLVKTALRRGVKRQLPKGYDMRHFTPSYDPWDQRLSAVPNGDLFKAIKRGTASVVTDHIDTFTETGIRLQSGEELEADIVISATGLELLFVGGMEVSVDGESLDIPNRLTYKGMMLEGLPNFAVAIGYTNASWTLKCDLTCDYVCRLINHMHETGLRQCTPTNLDAAVVPQPLLGLNSGYIQRSAHEFPKQGSKFPWQVHQSYVRDYRAMKMRSVVDEAMVYSNPAPVPAPEPAAVS